MWHFGTKGYFLEPCYLKRGPWTSNTQLSGRLVEMQSLRPILDLPNQNLLLTKSPGDVDAH